MDSMIGKVVKSNKGHDKDEYFIVIKADEIYAYLSDGKLRLLDNPKKKKIKHIDITNYIACDIKEKIESAARLNNSDIREAIENYKNKDAKGD